MVFCSWAAVCQAHCQDMDKRTQTPELTLNSLVLYGHVNICFLVLLVLLVLGKTRPHYQMRTVIDRMRMFPAFVVPAPTCQILLKFPNFAGAFVAMGRTRNFPTSRVPLLP